MTPTITPIAASMNVSLRKAATPSTVGSRPARAGFSGGAVRVCRLNAVMPTASSAAAASGPAWGNQATLSPTASGGPTISVTSSSTDSSAKAVRNSGWSRYSALQRARPWPACWA